MKKNLQKYAAFSCALFILSMPATVCAAGSESGTFQIDNIYINMCAAVIIAVFVLYFTVRHIKARKPELIERRVITLAPEGVDVCDAGYILRQYTDVRDVAAIFLDWMLNGVVFIEKGRGLSDTYIIKNKLNKEIPRNQKLIYNELFRNAGELTLDKITTVYPDILKDTRKRIIHKYDEKSTRLYSKPMSVLQDIITAAGAIPIAFLSGLCLNGNLSPRASAFIGAAVFFAVYYLSTLFLKACRLKKAADSIEDERSKDRVLLNYRKTRLIWIIFTILIYAFAGLMCVYAKRNVLPLILGIAAYVCALTVSPIFERRTERGEELSDELYSLKYYMAHTEDFYKQASFRAKTEPNYYYALLPYAYVLDVSDEWLKRAPDIYLTDGIDEEQAPFKEVFSELANMFCSCLTVPPK